MAFEKQQKNWPTRQLDRFRARLAHADALPQLAILGCISGLLTGLIAIAFRLSFELPLTLLLPNGSESFEALSPGTRFLLPVLGALIIGLLVHRFKPEQRVLGVGHILDRMQHHQAQLPAANALLQFIGAALALLTGHSVGREGPAVHLGAASSSLLGQQLQLPNNSLRTLTACGVAAAIAASFNTPLAGVIFAMEVVLMEYTITGFIPVILAAVSGGVLSRIAFGTQPAFAIPIIDMATLWGGTSKLGHSQNLRLKQSKMVRLNSYQITGKTPTTSGCATSKTGASAVRSGGDIAFLRGMTKTATCMSVVLKKKCVKSTILAIPS